MIGTLLLLTAAAADAPAAPAPIESNKALPEVALDSAMGAGKLSVKWGPTFYIGDRWDVTLAGLYTASASDGVSSLFQVNADQIGVANDWSIGPNLTFGHLTHARPDPAVVRSEEKAMRAAYASCATRCMPVNNVAKEDQDFCAVWRGQVSRALKAADFCDEQMEAMAKLGAEPAGAALKGYLKARSDALDTCLKPCEDPAKKTAFCTRQLVAPADASQHLTSPDALCPTGQYLWNAPAKEIAAAAASAFPSALISVGARFGQAHFTYLAPSAKVTSQVETTKNAPFTAAAGVSAVKVFNQGSGSTTLEGLFNVSSGYDESPDKAHTCRSVSPVVDPTQPAGDSNQVCKDIAYGAPRQSTKLTAAAYFGSVDQAAPFYRIALGPQGEWWATGGPEIRRLTFAIPVTFALFRFKEVKYQGLLRIAPSLGVAWHHGGGSDPSFGVALSLSAQNYLFSQQFDRL